MMKSLIFLALFALIAGRAADGWPQSAATAAQVPATQAPAAQGPATQAQGSTPALTAVQAQQALDVLQDPQKRAALIATLHAIAETAPAAPAPAATPAAPDDSGGTPAPAAAPAGAKTPAAVTLKPNSLGAQLLVAASRWSVRLAGDAGAILQTMNNLPALGRWFINLENDPQASLSLAIAAGWLALIFGVALLLEFFAIFALRRPRETLTRHLPGGDGERTRLLRMLPYALIGLVLDLVPVAVFAASGNLLIGVLPGIDPRTRLVVIAMVNAYAVCRAACASIAGSTLFKLCTGGELLVSVLPAIDAHRGTADGVGVDHRDHHEAASGRR